MGLFLPRLEAARRLVEVDKLGAQGGVEENPAKEAAVEVERSPETDCLVDVISWVEGIEMALLLADKRLDRL